MTPLTPEAPPEAVLAVARRLAWRYDPWGALEWDDYVGLACLGFYEAQARWVDKIGNFGAYAATWMRSTICQARREEGRQHGQRGQRRTPAQVAQRLAADRARYAARRRHPRHCERCGVEVAPQARWCEQHLTAKARAMRVYRRRAAAA